MLLFASVGRLESSTVQPFNRSCPRRSEHRPWMGCVVITPGADVPVGWHCPSLRNDIRLILRPSGSTMKAFPLIHTIHGHRDGWRVVVLESWMMMWGARRAAAGAVQPGQGLVSGHWKLGLGSARVARIIIRTAALPPAVSVSGSWETMCQHALTLTLRLTTSRDHPHVFGPCVGVGAREDVVPKFLMVGRKYHNVLSRICGLCAA